jgi:dTDP-4-dehydrorhamnose reductase
VTRWLVTGAGGLLGRDLLHLLRGAAEQASGLDHRDLDITDAAAVGRAFRELRPDLVVNCAAWTSVDEAEAHEAEALAVNGHGAAHVAAACSATGARLIHVSTDYVFSGTGRRPYPEDAATGPRTAYGRTKLAGERAVFEHLPGAAAVVRTAWLYGAHGPNFVRTMMRLERDRPAVDVVDDQHGQPTWAADVAAGIIALGRSGAACGIYHATSRGQTTWCGLAREVFRLLGADPARVTAVPTSAAGRPAPRPAYSVLGHAAWDRAGLPPFPGWRSALGRALPALRSAEAMPGPLRRKG